LSHLNCVEQKQIHLHQQHTGAIVTASVVLAPDINDPIQLDSNSTTVGISDILLYSELRDKSMMQGFYIMNTLNTEPKHLVTSSQVHFNIIGEQGL